MVNAPSRFAPGVQSARIRSAFMNRDAEVAALRVGVDPHTAARMNGGLGFDASLWATPPSVPPPSPVFTTTVTNDGGGSGLLSNIINQAGNFISSRWGQQRGTITYNPDGSIVQKQAAGIPISTQAPYVVGGTVPGSATSQFGGGFALGTGTMMMIGAGMLVLVLAMGKRR